MLQKWKKREKRKIILILHYPHVEVFKALSWKLFILQTNKKQRCWKAVTKKHHEAILK